MRSVPTAHGTYDRKWYFLAIFFEDSLIISSNILDKRYPINCPQQANQSRYFKTDCRGHCSDGTVMQLLTAHNEMNVLDHPEFWLFVAFMVLSWAAMASVVSLADTICFQMLGEHHGLYGNQRLWGAIGWGIFAFLSGILVDEMSRGQLLKDYSIVFYMMICLIGLDLIFSSKIEVFTSSFILRGTDHQRLIRYIFGPIPAQANRSFFTNSQRYRCFVHVTGHCNFLRMVHCGWTVYGIDLEFLVLAFGGVGRC